MAYFPVELAKNKYIRKFIPKNSYTIGLLYNDDCNCTYMYPNT